MRLLRNIAALGAVLAFVAACSQPVGTGAAGSSGELVATRTSSALGTILVDHRGKTLYFAEGETASSVKCTGPCLGFWTPLTSAAATPPTSSHLSGTLAKFRRGDGHSQLTYDGHPLYTFRLDTAAGDTKGNDFTDDFGRVAFHWHAITTEGTAASGGSQPAASPYASSGYRY